MARTTADLSRCPVTTPNRWTEVSLPVDLSPSDPLPALTVHVEGGAPRSALDDLVDGIVAGVVRPGAWSAQRVRVLAWTLSAVVVGGWARADLLPRRDEPGGLPIRPPLGDLRVPARRVAAESTGDVWADAQGGGRDQMASTGHERGVLRRSFAAGARVHQPPGLERPR